METKLVVLKAFKILAVCVVSDIKLSAAPRSFKPAKALTFSRVLNSTSNITYRETDNQSSNGLFSNGGTRIHLGTINNYACDVLITNYDAINT